VVLTQPTYAPTFTMHRQQALAHASEQPDALTLDTSPRLAAPVSMHAPPLPPELTTHECAALLRAADPDTQRALALLLSGVAPHEAIALSWKDLDAASRLLHIGGSDARTMTLAAGAVRLFERQGRDDGAPLLPGPSGGSATMESLTAQLVCAAHDAGLENVQDISPAAVRHSYIAFLVRQGARFADLTRWVGRLDAELLAAYSTLTPPGKRLDGSTIRLDFPALEQFESGAL
jgi:integrase